MEGHVEKERIHKLLASLEKQASLLEGLRMKDVQMVLELQSMSIVDPWPCLSTTFGPMRGEIIKRKEIINSEVQKRYPVPIPTSITCPDGSLADVNV